MEAADIEYIEEKLDCGEVLPHDDVRELIAAYRSHAAEVARLEGELQRIGNEAVRMIGESGRKQGYAEADLDSALARERRLREAAAVVVANDLHTETCDKWDGAGCVCGLGVLYSALSAPAPGEGEKAACRVCRNAPPDAGGDGLCTACATTYPRDAPTPPPLTVGEVPWDCTCGRRVLSGNTCSRCGGTRVIKIGGGE